MRIWIAFLEESGLPLYVGKDDELHVEDGLAVFADRRYGKKWLKANFPGLQIVLKPAELRLS